MIGNTWLLIWHIKLSRIYELIYLSLNYFLIIPKCLCIAIVQEFLLFIMHWKKNGFLQPHFLKGGIMLWELKRLQVVRTSCFIIFLSCDSRKRKWQFDRKPIWNSFYICKQHKWRTSVTWTREAFSKSNPSPQTKNQKID